MNHLEVVSRCEWIIFKLCHDCLTVNTIIVTLPFALAFALALGRRAVVAQTRASTDSRDHFARHGALRPVARAHALEQAVPLSINVSTQKMKPLVPASSDHTFMLHPKPARQTSAGLTGAVESENEARADDKTGKGTLAAAYANRGIIKDRSEDYNGALKDYVKALGIDYEAVAGPGLGTVILNYKFKSSSVKERALYLNEQLQLPENERILKIEELDEGQVMHKPGKL